MKKYSCLVLLFCAVTSFSLPTTTAKKNIHTVIRPAVISGLNCYNSTSTDITLSLYNYTTGSSYTFTLHPGAGAFGPIDDGSYVIYMDPVTSGTYSYTINNQTRRSSTGATFYLTISGTCGVGVSN